MTDKIKACREAFEKWFSETNSEGAGLSNTIALREFVYQAWKDAWNTRAQTEDWDAVVAGNAMRDKIEEILLEHCLTFSQTDDGDPYPLIDLLSVDADDIGRGKEECYFLADAIAGDLPVYTHPPRAQEAGEDARDAARYRWLRKLDDRASSGVLTEPSSMAYLDDEELDAAIDAAMQGDNHES